MDRVEFDTLREYSTAPRRREATWRMDRATK